LQQPNVGKKRAKEFLPKLREAELQNLFISLLPKFITLSPGVSHFAQKMKVGTNEVISKCKICGCRAKQEQNISIS
jgi:hypothetical protein